MKLVSVNISTPRTPVTRRMINPHMLRPAHKQWREPGFAGGKIYFAILVDYGAVYRARVMFKRASEAGEYAVRLKVRWIGLYEAAIKLNPALAPNPLQD